MSKIKVLMVTPYLPYPPYSGGQTRSFNLIKNLAKKCELTLFHFVLPDQNVQDAKYLKKYCRKIISFQRGKTWTLKKIVFTAASPYPFLISNYYSPELKEALRKELNNNNYDLLHVECFYLMPNIPKINKPVILVDQTIEFAVYQHFVETLPPKFFPLKPFLWLDVQKLKFWETKFWKQADTLIAVSGDDKKLMEKLSQRKVEVVPNGVADDFLKTKNFAKYAKPTVLYGVANFKWMQNKEGAVNLLKYVWPKIKKSIPEAQLYIAGRHSASFLEKLNFTPKFKNSISAGDVLNPQEVYSKSWVLLAPIKSGGGSRTKFFEAMACKLPVITTPQGIEGIEAKNNQQVMIAKSFNKLAEITIKMLKNKNKAKSIGQKGHFLVKEKYSWKVSSKKLLDVYQKI